MDILQDSFPQLFHLYSTYYTPYASYIQPLRRVFLLTQSYFYYYAFPTLYPIYTLTSRLFAFALTEKQSLTSLALLALLLVVSLKVLDMVRRTIIYWVSLAIRLLMYLSVAVLGMWVYQRGVEQSLEDLGWVVGLLAGLGEAGERVGHEKAAGRAREARKISKGSSSWKTREAGW